MSSSILAERVRHSDQPLDTVLSFYFSGIKKRFQPGKGKPSQSAAQFVNNSNLGDLVFDFVDEGLYQQEKMFNHLMGIYFRKTNRI